MKRPIILLLLQVGDKVKKGQVICIIEAMKMMNEIEVCISFPICYSILLHFFSYLFTMLFTLCFPIYLVYLFHSIDYPSLYSTIQKSVIQKSGS